MSLFPFVVVASAGTAISLVFVRRPWIGLLAGLAAIALAALVLVTATDSTAFTLEGVTFLTTPYARVLGSVALVVGLLVILIAAIDRPEPVAAPVLISVVAGMTIAMACSEVGVGLTFVAAAAFLASAIGLGTSAGETRASALLREVRGVVIGLMGGLVATGLIGNGTPGSGAGGLPVEAPVAGIAFGVIAVVFAHRFGAVPLHARVARIGATVPSAVLPAMLAVLPAAWGAVLLGWSAPAIAEYATGLPVERGLIVAAALLAMGLGSVAALLADDVASVVAYMIVAESGLGLLALATVEASVVGPARTWLVVFVAGRTALLGWAIAFRAVFGTGRVRETSGWARRAPVLAGTLVVAAIAGIGWPGLAAWDARVAILEASTGGQLLLLAYAASLGTIVAVARLLVVGARRPSAVVAAAPLEIPRMPRAATVRPAAARIDGVATATAEASPEGAARVGLGADGVLTADGWDADEWETAEGREPTDARDATDTPPLAAPTDVRSAGAQPGAVRTGRARSAGADAIGVRAILAMNRTVIRALGMTVLAVVALVVAAGGLGLTSASATGAPAPIASQAPGGIDTPDGRPIVPNGSSAPDGTSPQPGESPAP